MGFSSVSGGFPLLENHMVMDHLWSDRFFDDDTSVSAYSYEVYSSQFCDEPWCKDCPGWLDAFLTFEEAEIWVKGCLLEDVTIGEGERHPVYVIAWFDDSGLPKSVYYPPIPCGVIVESEKLNIVQNKCVGF